MRLWARACVEIASATKGFRRPVPRSRRARRPAVGVTVSGGLRRRRPAGRGRAVRRRIGTYVWACRQLGYQHPDLTAHPAQIRDWYGHDDGLDLVALDADCAALSAAAAAADDAFDSPHRADGGVGGRLVRHGRRRGARIPSAAERSRRSSVRDGLRHAAEAMATLRDELWRAVDAKVATVLDIDDRRLAQRAEWLAAAQAVTTGAGDRAAASELVDQQIKPFVDNDIRSDWLAAMHRAMACGDGGLRRGARRGRRRPGRGLRRARGAGPTVGGSRPGRPPQARRPRGDGARGRVHANAGGLRCAAASSVAEPVSAPPAPPARSTGTAGTSGCSGTVHRPDVRRAAPAAPPPMPSLGEPGRHALARNRSVRLGSAACRPHRRTARVVGRWNAGAGRPRSGRRRPDRSTTPNPPTRQTIPQRTTNERTTRQGTVAEDPDAAEDAGRRRRAGGCRRDRARPRTATRRDARTAAARARAPDPACRAGSRARGEDSVRNCRRRATAGGGVSQMVSSRHAKAVATKSSRAGFAAAASQISVTRPGPMSSIGTTATSGLR